jgi:hypothetical protein
MKKILLASLILASNLAIAADKETVKDYEYNDTNNNIALEATISNVGTSSIAFKSLNTLLLKGIDSANQVCTVAIDLSKVKMVTSSIAQFHQFQFTINLPQGAVSPRSSSMLAQGYIGFNPADPKVKNSTATGNGFFYNFVNFTYNDCTTTIKNGSNNGINLVLTKVVN